MLAPHEVLVRSPLALVVVVAALSSKAAEPAAPPPADAMATLREMLGANEALAKSRGDHFFDAFQTGQHPRTTLVSCADSRVQTSDFEANPDGDIFVVRNIGNQIDTAAGSVEYGVSHLKTPLLLILGHVGCGAVKAALSDYSDESAPLRRELDSLHLAIARGKAAAHADPWLDGVVENVHLQVALARHEYKEEVKSGALVVVGAVYDFTNALGRGRGRIVVVDLNGERDAKKIDAALAATKSAAPVKSR